MRKLIATLATVSVLGACSNGATIGAADLADAGTSAAVIAQGGSELNPALNFAGDSAAPLVMLGVKYAGQSVMIESGMEPEEARKWADAAGWLGTCNNLLQLAGTEMVVSVTAGVVCAVAAFKMQDE